MDATSSTQNARSVQPLWCLALPIQQQSVLLLAARGPDGIAKSHPCKDLQRAYRGTVLVAARYGRCLRWGESADTFMGLDVIAQKMVDWELFLDRFFQHSDDLPHHFLMHLMHGAEILGYKHPEERFKSRWKAFYQRCVKELHLVEESEDEMDWRLSDWERKHWEETSVPDAKPALNASGASLPNPDAVYNRRDEGLKIETPSCSPAAGIASLKSALLEIHAANHDLWAEEETQWRHDLHKKIETLCSTLLSSCAPAATDEEQANYPKCPQCGTGLVKVEQEATQKAVSLMSDEELNEKISVLLRLNYKYGDACAWWKRLPDYCHDLNAALTLCEVATHNGWALRFFCRREWELTWKHEDGRQINIGAPMDKLARAISHAFYLAMTGTDDSVPRGNAGMAHPFSEGQVV